jgi:hypothetical protein
MRFVGKNCSIWTWDQGNEWLKMHIQLASTLKNNLCENFQIPSINLTPFHIPFFLCEQIIEFWMLELLNITQGQNITSS